MYLSSSTFCKMYLKPSYVFTILLAFCLSLGAVNGQSPYLYSFCLVEGNYTSNSPYHTNLNTLLDLLAKKVPPTGFGLGSTGGDENQVNGLALCRGDVSEADCKFCVLQGSKELQARCPNSEGAVIWYDYCLLKYSSIKFFGEIDFRNKFALLNVKDVDTDPIAFNQKVNNLLTSLAKKATSVSKLYATEQKDIGGSMTLYGLAQCTRDLSSSDCKKCLDDAISGIPDCCSGKRGGRVVGGSCYVRYELYPIVDEPSS